MNDDATNTEDQQAVRFDPSQYTLPIVGPGSQPSETDGAELDILQLPSGMDTYAAPLLPEPEDTGNTGSRRKDVG